MHIKIIGVMLYIFEISVKNSIEWYITNAQKFNSEKSHFSRNGQKWPSAHFQTHAAKNDRPRFQKFFFIFFTKSWTFRKTYLELPLLRFGHSNPTLNRILSNFVVRKRFFQLFTTKVLIKLISIIHRWIRLEKSYRMVYHMCQKVYLRST